jgi:integrase
MLEQLHRRRVGLRDRALLLLGFAGVFRQSELVALDVADLEFARAGLIVTLSKSRTDQEGKNRRLGIPFGSSEATCPSGQSRPGSMQSESVRGQCSRRWTSSSECSRSACPTRPWRGSSREERRRPASIPRGMPATR